jgi:H+/Cl- antiporter ClcA
MIDTEAKPKPYFRLMALVALMGIVSALVTFVFMAFVNGSIAWIWEASALALGMDPRLFTLLVCTLGGLLVGLLVNYFGDHNAIFSELMREFGKTGRFDYRHAPGILVTSFISLIAGAALGPESALADTCGGIGTWIADRLKLDEKETRTMGFGGLSAMLGAFVTNPFGGALLSLESAQGGMTGLTIYFWGLFPSLLAAAVATTVFVALTGSFFDTLYAFPAYTPRLADLLWAVPFSLIGGLAGLIFMFVFQKLRQLMQPLKNHLVLRSVIGGLGMGIIGALLPLTLFSGEEGSTELIKQAATIGFGMLILLAICKLLATSLLLATGWKGGYIFPVMFAGVALGMAGKLLFPFVPTAVIVASTLAGVLVASLRAPLFAAFFTLVLVQAETAPVVAVAVIVSSFLMALVVLRQARAKAQAQATPQSVVP